MAAGARMKKQVAVLALQGDFAEHLHALDAAGACGFLLRKSEELAKADALIIPGGESTAIAKLSKDNNDPIFDTIKKKIDSGLPVYGTCMGSIFLAKEIEGSQQGRLASMDIRIKRNAFGSQQNSFETELSITCLGEPNFLAVFIRAPLVTACAANVEILASLPASIIPKQDENSDGISVSNGGNFAIRQNIVMARQDNILVSAFHPELTSDWRIHKYFLRMIS
jgi:pyridoxal 5'-phosphate synthase pdxT subunit